MQNKHKSHGLALQVPLCFQSIRYRCIILSGILTARRITHIDDTRGVSPRIAVFTICGSRTQKGETFLGEVEDALQIKRKELRESRVLISNKLENINVD